MTEREQNLLRASRFIRRLDRMMDHKLDVEGVPAREVAWAIEETVAQSSMLTALDDVIASRRVDAPPLGSPLRLLPGGAA